MSKPLSEAVKEFFRVVVIAIIPVVVDGLSRNVIDMRLVAVAGSIAGLRAIEKWLHESDRKALPF